MATASSSEISPAIRVAGTQSRITRLHVATPDNLIIPPPALILEGNRLRTCEPSSAVPHDSYQAILLELTDTHSRRAGRPHTDLSNCAPVWSTTGANCPMVQKIVMKGESG